MTTFDDRENGFEQKFAHDEELAFKTTARRNKLVGLWAAEKLGKSGDEAAAYAKEVVLADFEKAGDDDIIEKIAKDFAAKNIAIPTKQISKEIERLQIVARAEIMGKTS